MLKLFINFYLLAALKFGQLKLKILLYIENLNQQLVFVIFKEWFCCFKLNQIGFLLDFQIQQFCKISLGCRC